MGFNEASGFCNHCNKQVMIRRKETNHVLHLFLCVFTVGFWLPFWFLLSFKIGGWRCSQCGGKVRRSGFLGWLR